MQADILYLISVTSTQDNTGVLRSTETRRKVYCKAKSATQTEFYEGGRSGLNPEYRFSVFAPEYHGETICEYKGKRYSVYRTYGSRQYNIDLYCERKGGSVHGD